MPLHHVGDTKYPKTVVGLAYPELAEGRNLFLSFRHPRPDRGSSVFLRDLYSGRIPDRNPVCNLPRQGLS